LKRWTILLAVLGLLATTLLVGWYGFHAVGRAMLSVGAGGFAIFCVWQLTTMALLGVGWRAVAPPPGGNRLWPFVWGRMVRDSASACLPFSTVGGFVLGVRAATLHGIDWSTAALSMVVDLMAEFLAEIAFAVAGLCVLLTHGEGQALTAPLAAAFALMLLLGGAALVMRKRAAPIFVRMGRRIFGDVFGAPGNPTTDREHAERFGDARRMALSTAIHFAGWFCKGIGNWIAFRLLGSGLSLLDALAIEGLLHALLIPAFIVPGYVGVQEAGYAGIGMLFGVPPEISLAVSLLRRARDLALGTPILLFWQFAEVKRLRT
jgi:putative membrane protein